MKRKAVDWNNLPDDFTKTFWDQNIRQFWVDEEIPLSDDKLSWKELHADEQDTYTKVLTGLTLLDTEQGSVGMPQIASAVDDLHHKSVLSFMGFMEHMHAKSYSSIFSTICTTEKIKQLFDWVESYDNIQSKLDLILTRYNKIHDRKSLYMAMVSSVFLETFLFYSGFFYPLYLSGQGKMANSGEIINLILRDESVHGVFVGLLAQKEFKNLSSKEQDEVQKETKFLLEELYEHEKIYTNELYKKLSLENEVDKFIQYNADKALMNLGMNTYFNINEEEINTVVLNGLRTETKNHDFFSTKGNGYIKTLKVSELKDDDFDV